MDAIVIQESPYKELPESVSRVLDSRPLTYAADGMLYCEELVSQASATGLVVHRFPRKSDQIAAASGALGGGQACLAEPDSLRGHSSLCESSVRAALQCFTLWTSRYYVFGRQAARVEWTKGEM